MAGRLTPLRTTVIAAILWIPLLAFLARRLSLPSDGCRDNRSMLECYGATLWPKDIY
jgi:hypothetical protein